MYIYIHVPANTVALCTRNTALLRPVVDYARGSKSIPSPPPPRFSSSFLAMKRNVRREFLSR